MTQDLRTITGNPQTQAQLRDTIANLDATMQKANSLLGELGGTSSVYGVDAGATPPPPAVPAARRIRCRRSHHGAPPPQQRFGPQDRANCKARSIRYCTISSRFNCGSAVSRCSKTPALNPVLTKSQGPLGDINLVVLPHAYTSFMVGANSIGNNTTWNAVLLNSSEADFASAAASFTRRSASRATRRRSGLRIETRIYDLTYPMIDLYGNIRLARSAEVFFGQRDVTHASRRNTFGLQYQF